MKVLVLTPTNASYAFLQTMLVQMRDKGWDMHFASSDFTFGENVPANAGITFHSVPFPRGADVKGHLIAARHLRKLVADIQPDVIDVHFSATMLTCALARQANWPPVLATIQGLRFPTQSGARGKVEQWVECWSAKRMYSVTVLTADDYQALVDAGVGNAVLQKALGFGCNLEKFDSSLIAKDEKSHVRQEIGLREADLPLIFVGRKTAFKGFHRVVSAFSIVAEKHPELRLIVCGNADPIHPSGLTASQEHDYQTNKRIVDMGWVDNVRPLLAISYLNIFPSEREGMPVNLMESLAMGVPVVTFNSRGCRDVVSHESTGIVVKDLSPQTLADAISHLVENSDIRQRYSDTALAQRDKFNRQHFIDERMRVFSATVAAHGQVRSR